MASSGSPEVLDTGPSRRFRLRDATRAEHGRLDGLISTAGFLTSRSRYATYLSATLSARAAVEQALDDARAGEVYSDWPHRRISRWIEQDLLDLGHVPAPASKPPGFRLGGRGEIWGALYVLEGASLGARLLQKAALALGFDAQRGARHMAAQTAEAGAWTRFTARLDAQDLDAMGEAACVQAAAQVFERFEQAYQQVLEKA